jgi:hypothetical protein
MSFTEAIRRRFRKFAVFIPSMKHNRNAFDTSGDQTDGQKEGTLSLVKYSIFAKKKKKKKNFELTLHVNNRF